MKISGYVMMVLMIGLIFVSVNLILEDLGNQYGTNMSIEDDDYVYGTEISSSMTNLQESLNKLGDEDQGWFSRLGAGITAIPYAIVASVGEIFSAQGYLSTMITETGSELNIDRSVINLLTIMLIISVIFAIIAFLHRARA